MQSRILGKNYEVFLPWNSIATCFLVLLFCYRIPEFREKLLSIIVHKDDIEIVEWRGTEYVLDETKNVQLNKNDEFVSLFDWDQGFYRFLKPEERGE